MKAELKLRDHNIIAHDKVIEVWWNGKMIATVVGADGPGVRIISKYHLQLEDKSQGPLTVYEIKTHDTQV